METIYWYTSRCLMKTRQWRIAPDEVCGPQFRRNPVALTLCGSCVICNVSTRKHMEYTYFTCAHNMQHMYFTCTNTGHRACIPVGHKWGSTCISPAQTQTKEHAFRSNTNEKAHVSHLLEYRQHSTHSGWTQMREHMYFTCTNTDKRARIPVKHKWESTCISPAQIQTT